ncbi:MAG: Dam family site-specific DNA-(adenine-N6)-methyltransferase [Patescibacteria group bacterium]
MLPLSIQSKLNQIKSSCLVLDIECSSHYSNGQEIDIKRDFDNYVQYAQVKWVGAFSFKNNKSYYLNAITHRNQIVQLLKEHDVIVSFNGEDFDWPIIVNNGLSEMGKRYLQVDLMQILGTSNQKNRGGYKFKNKANLMEIKLKNNSLRCMAEAFGLETQKGDIDFHLFQKNEWTEEETNEIFKYLSADVLATKELFLKAWVYWLPFAELLDEKFVYDLSWLRSSVASLAYKALCRVLETEPTYSDKSSGAEEMGGFVLLPKQEESWGVWYVDYTSLYPNIFSCFNLTSESYLEDICNEIGCSIEEFDINKQDTYWHGNDLFEVKGYYNKKEWHILAKWIAEKLEERINLKKSDPENSKIYTLKIILNTIYGIIRAIIFEKVYRKNAGYDCCWIGQQINKFTREMLEQFGFDILQSDTDGFMIKARDEKNNNKEYVQSCLNQIIEILKEYMLFPTDNFTIKIEEYFDYLLSPFSDQEVVDDEIREQLNKGLITGYIEKEINKKKCIVEEATGNVVKIGRSWVKARKGRKKNYLYIYEDKKESKVKLVGLPLIKDTATPLGMQIFKEVLEPLILKNKRAKFPKEFIDQTINDYLKKDGVIESLATEYKVQKFEGYKNPSQIQAQVSKEYFGGEAGVIRLIKNSKIGRVGKGMLYASIEEAKKANLTAKEIDLEKVNNELEPFIQHVEYIEVMPPNNVYNANFKKIPTDDDFEKAAMIITYEEDKIVAENTTDKQIKQLAIDYCNLKEIDITKYSKTKDMLYPFKWPGNKKTLLPILQEIFKQSKCDSIHEAFAGSAVFSLNTVAKSYTICDINEHVINLWLNIKNHNKELIEAINSYSPEIIRDNQDYYVDLRSKFNKLNHGVEKSALFHILLGSCTNGLARFNSKGEFNQTWGARCVKHSLETLENQVKKFTILLQSYEQTQIKDNTLLYLDPPYLLSNDCYTAKGWNEKEEEKFLNWVSTMNCKWALSNIISKDSRKNELLQSFGKMYNVYYLSKKYNAKVGGYSDDKTKHQAQEVLITNFEAKL